MSYVSDPHWIVKTFGGLCFCQVKEQLHENLVYDLANPAAFTFDGQLFVFTDNRMLVAELVTDPFTNLN